MTYTQADLYNLMIRDQAEKFETSTEVIEAAHMLFAGADPAKIEELHAVKGYNVSLADCIRHMKIEMHA